MDYKEIQFGNLLQRELSDVIAKNVDFPKGVLVTVMKIKISKEKKQAEVYINVIPNAFLGKILRLLNKRAPYLKFLLNKRLSSDLPDLIFLLNTEEDIEWI